MNYSGKLHIKVKIKSDYIRTDGTCAVYLQIFLNKEKKIIPLDFSVAPIHFENQRVKATHPFANDFNLIIEKALADINKIEINYRLSNVPLTIEKLVLEYTNPSSRMDFCTFWQAEMENQKHKLKPGTYRQQMSVLGKLKKYKPVVYFYEIDNDFIAKIEKHLKVKLGNSDNTVASFIKSFKKYLHIANKRGIITPVLHDDIKRASFTTSREFLLPAEIVKLYNYYSADFVNATHKAILSRFLFSCFTGLRISDIQKLTTDNFAGDLLFFTSEKTGKIQKMKLNNSALKFIDPEAVFYGNFSNEYINRELKFIAKACAIKKTISFHVARHTFATNYLLSGGNVVNLQKLLGHSKIDETMIYVHVVESITDIEIMNMDEILK